MKSILTIFIALSSLTIQAEAKNSRKLASTELNLAKSDLALILNKSKGLSQLTAMANDYFESKNMNCSELIDMTEIKSVDLITETIATSKTAAVKTYSFEGQKVCTENGGTNSAPVKYEGLIRNSKLQNLTIKFPELNN